MPTECVLFDFDGPICRLFAHYPAASAAQLLKTRLRRDGLLPSGLEDCWDPHRVLRNTALDAAIHTSALCRELDDLLSKEELAAAATAELTPGATELIRRLRAQGRRLAVVSNNAPEAVQHVLWRFDLLDSFAGTIVARPSCARLMKPHHDMVDRAVAGLKSAPERCVMIGDSAADLGAAQGAGVRFVGYARNDRKKRQLVDSGALMLVERMEDAGELLL
jgi:HAD superfamily hydrolase (TIGR01509 family)